MRIYTFRPVPPPFYLLALIWFGHIAGRTFSLWPRDCCCGIALLIKFNFIWCTTRGEEKGVNQGI